MGGVKPLAITLGDPAGIGPEIVPASVRVVDAALAVGATLERPVTEQPYGRGGVVVDADGHRWIVARGVPAARPGDVIYASLWAQDADRARRFFGAVLGDVGRLGTAEAPAPTLMCCYEVPDVDARVVRLAELDQHLPADTARVTAEERAAALVARDTGFQLRSLW